MHILQPRHIKLKSDEVKKLTAQYNITVSQLPKIHLEDAAVPEGCIVGDVIKIERKEKDISRIYYRVVVA